jgi:serine-type D-Ala-D-Ala carboxypeptidase (penicillin-binding protein 5/6)
MFKISFFLPLLIVALLSAVFVAFDMHNNPPSLTSPVLGIKKVSMANNIWLPGKSLLNIEASDSPPEITAESAFFIDTKSGTVLFEKNSHKKMPVASLGKIMTAIITMENLTLDEEIEIKQRHADMEPDKMYLIAGDKLTVRDLLNGIFLVSANDAAEALADSATGRREEFINLMNSKAKMLGMNNTHFINPTGLEEDDPEKEGQLIAQYSTAYDVALMSRYAISKWPSLVEISSKPQILIPQTSTHQAYDLYNGINLVTTYSGVVGFKTGYTPSAGLTLVTLARKDGYEVLGVILNATDRREDARLLLDYSFEKLEGV